MVTVIRKVGKTIFIIDDTPTQVVSIKMRKDFVEKLDALCSILKMSRSEFIRRAVEEKYKLVIEEKKLGQVD